MDLELHQRAIDLETSRLRLQRALGSCELALAELERRGDVTGLLRLRDDLRSALELLGRGGTGVGALGSGEGRGSLPATPAALRPPAAPVSGLGAAASA